MVRIALLKQAAGLGRRCLLELLELESARVGAEIHVLIQARHPVGEIVLEETQVLGSIIAVEGGEPGEELVSGRLRAGKRGLRRRHFRRRRLVSGRRSRVKGNLSDTVGLGSVHLHGDPQTLPADACLRDCYESVVGRLLHFLEIKAAHLAVHCDCLIDEVRRRARCHDLLHKSLNGGSIAARERRQPSLELFRRRRIGKCEMGLRCGRLGHQPRHFQNCKTGGDGND